MKFSKVDNKKSKKAINTKKSWDSFVRDLSDPTKKGHSKDGEGIVPAFFATNPSQRKSKHAVGVGLLALDIEDHDYGTDEQNELEDLLRDKIPDTKMVVYTTSSHGVRQRDGKQKWMEGHPRLRIIIPLKDVLDVRENDRKYKALYSWASDQIDGVDPGCKDCVRISFLPRKKHPDAEKSPWISIFDGEFLDVDHLPGGGSLDEYIEKLNRAKQRERRDAVDYAHSKGLSEDELREMLSVIGPIEDREPWIRVLFGFLHYVRVENKIHEDMALELLTEWSKKADSYEPGCVEEFFDKNEPREGENSITIGTAIWMAKQEGWEPPVRKSAFSSNSQVHLKNHFIEHFLTQRTREKFFDTTGMNAFVSDEVEAKPVYVLHDFYAYDTKKGHWVKRSEAELKTKIGDFYDGKLHFANEKPAKIRMSQSSISGVLSLVQQEATLNAEKKTGGNPSDFFSKPGSICLDNAAVHFQEDGSFHVFEEGSHPEMRVRHVLPFSYDETAKCPVFDQYLEDVFENEPDKKEKKMLLQEYVGASVFGYAHKAQKILMLTGDGGGGKSKFLGLIESLFYPDDVAHVSPQDMSMRFRGADLAHARVNIVADVDAEELYNTGLLKQITGGDTIAVERKHKDVQSAKITAGHLFSCNELPATSDFSTGFWDRWLVVSFNKNFREGGAEAHKRDRNIEEKLRNEREGVLLWLIEGAKRWLRNDMKFTIPSSMKEDMAEWRRSTDTVSAFVDECCEKTDHSDGDTPADLYDAFKNYVEKVGRGQLSKDKFGKRLHGLGYDKGRPTVNGKRKRRYNLSLSDGSSMKKVDFDLI